MHKTIVGIVHGRTIEVEEDLGVADGQQVRIQVTFVQPSQKGGAGIRSSAGGWSDVPDIDAILEKVRNEHRLERRPQVGEV